MHGNRLSKQKTCGKPGRQMLIPECFYMSVSKCVIICKCTAFSSCHVYVCLVYSYVIINILPDMFEVGIAFYPIYCICLSLGSLQVLLDLALFVRLWVQVFTVQLPASLPPLSPLVMWYMSVIQPQTDIKSHPHHVTVSINCDADSSLTWDSGFPQTQQYKRSEVNHTVFMIASLKTLWL